MKKLLLIPLFLTTFVSAHSLAKSQDEEDKVRALNEATLHGELIFGGIMLAQKCVFLQPSEYDDYAAKSYAVVDLLKKVLGKDEVNNMVKRAQVDTLTPPYNECGEESKTFVSDSKIFVEYTYNVLSAK